MDALPPTLGNAVVESWADLGDAEPTGNSRHVVAGKEVSSFAGLAISRYPGASDFYLFYCDETWQVVTDTWHEDPESAKRQAEFEFGPVIWQSAT